MSKRQFRLINSISHRYLTIDDHILRTVDQKQALIVSEAVGRQLLKKVNRIAEALAQANGTAFNEYRLEEAPLATIRLGSEDLDALIETVQLLGCSLMRKRRRESSIKKSGRLIKWRCISIMACQFRIRFGSKQT